MATEMYLLCNNIVMKKVSKCGMNNQIIIAEKVKKVN